ncbi:MAG: thioredoxin domain-containing protein [Dermatophilaceae bacterium]
MANRLADATSPYLLQHAGNPVDWWEWGPEAFEEARRRDVPVLLSVGYAACHWCHVMARESFEDAQVAQALADGFVAIKVDREERPDIDAIYMSATVALTGRGGWPMTVLVTPEARPIWAGTYLPKASLLQLLASARDVWLHRREDIETSGRQIADALATATRPASPRALGEGELDAALQALRRDYDARHGGFGGAPKFPPSMVLDWLLAHQARTGDADALSMVTVTCEAMARGGVYDQLAGGFARYGVDADWAVPHFEKMLYDNAQLLGVYARLHQAASDAPGAQDAPAGYDETADARDDIADLAARVARETAEFLLRDLRTPQGAFASSLDADTDGLEGLTYVWTPGDLAAVLGPPEGARAAELLAVTREGTFERGASTLQLRRDPSDAAWWNGVRARLLAARNGRPQPARDDKVVTAWNGLAIGALADAGVLLGEPAYVQAAAVCADFLVEKHWVGGRLRRTSLGGRVSDATGVATDYADLAAGLLRLAQASGQAKWAAVAGDILDVAIAHFSLPDGGFADTPDDGQALVIRPRDVGDNAEPCAQSALAGALSAYGALAGSARHLERSLAALQAMGELAVASPRFAGHALTVAEWVAAGPLQVGIVAADERDPAGLALLRVARRAGSPGMVLAFGPPDAPGWALLADRPLTAGRSTAYVCRGVVCDAPVTDPRALEALLARRGP